MSMIQLTSGEVARFRTKVRQTPGEDCWLWTGELNSQGYGRFVVYRDGRRVRLLTHRVAYTLAKNPGTAVLEVVRHCCDTPLCCRPAHLLVGTQKDNMADAAARGRINRVGLDAGRAANRAAAEAILTAGEKLCRGCDQVLPLVAFYRNRRTLHGRQSRCKACQATLQRRRQLGAAPTANRRTRVTA